MKDAEYMERAIKLAARGLGHTRPNPAVGAVIVKGGKIIGEGWHKDSQRSDDLRDPRAVL